MALVKQDHNLEKATFVFDQDGEVTDLVLTVNFQIFDNVENEELTRVRKENTIWDSLTANQKSQANSIGKKLNTLAKEF